jgi:hypothetical protein
MARDQARCGIKNCPAHSLPSSTSCPQWAGSARSPRSSSLPLLD